MFIYFIYLDFFLLVVIAICTHAFVEFSSLILLKTLQVKTFQT